MQHFYYPRTVLSPNFPFLFHVLVTAGLFPSLIDLPLPDISAHCSVSCLSCDSLLPSAPEFIYAVPHISISFLIIPNYILFSSIHQWGTLILLPIFGIEYCLHKCPCTHQVCTDTFYPCLTYVPKILWLLKLCLKRPWDFSNLISK